MQEKKINIVDESPFNLTVKDNFFLMTLDIFLRVHKVHKKLVMMPSARVMHKKCGICVL